MKYLDKYPNCIGCPVSKYCGTMIGSIVLCNSYQDNKKGKKMKDKINILLDLLQGTESVEFSIYRGKPDEYNGKHRIELHLDRWYKPIFGDSWDECIDKAIEFIKGENKMNYEEKYKQALERAKYLKENTDSVGAKDISYNFEYIFPELRESEDERIRKAILHLVQHSGIATYDGINWLDMVSWLEKQGKQKSWSEEDEKMVEDIIEAIDTQYPVSNYSEMASWLQSIKPNHWKPSEFQLECLKKVIPHNNTEKDCELEDVLTELYNDLKKL